jgi:2,3-dihydroxybenzoate decarboxylase
MPMLRNLSSYWQTNLLETVSGNFATELFNFHVNQIGLDRIMYSVSFADIYWFERGSVGIPWRL